MKAELKERVDNSEQPRLELSRKIRKTNDRLQESCAWANSLATQLNEFPEMLSRVCTQLDKLRMKVKFDAQLDGEGLRELAFVLRGLNKCRQRIRLAKKDPLTVTSITNCLELENYRESLARIMIRLGIN